MEGNIKMHTAVDIKRRLERVFERRQADALAEVITDAYSELVKTSDFNELKEIVRDIGIKTAELSEAHKRTEVKVAELSEAQEELADEMRILAKGG